MAINFDKLFIVLILYLWFNMIVDFSSKFKKVSFFINLVILTCITGSFYEKVGLGGDYDNYRNIFIYLKPNKVPDSETGFHYLNVFLKLFTNDFYIVFLVFMFIINVFILKTIYQHSKQIELSLLLYVIICGYVLSANIVRQYIAASIYFYSIKFLLNKKYIIFILLNMIAFSFHTTVIIPIILVIIVNIFNEKLYKNYLAYFISVNALIVIEPIIRKFGIQLVDKGYTESSFNYGSSILHYLVQVAFIMFYYFNKNKIVNNKEKLYMNLVMLSIGFTLLSTNMVLYARLASYFNLFHILLTPYIVVNIDSVKEKRLIVYCIFMGLSIYYLLLTSKSINAYSGNYIVDFFNNIFY